MHRSWGKGIRILNSDKQIMANIPTVLREQLFETTRLPSNIRNILSSYEMFYNKVKVYVILLPA